MAGHFTAYTRVFETTEGRVDTHLEVVVDVHLAALATLDHLVANLHVVAEDRANQAVAGAIRTLNNLVHVLKFEH